MVPVGQEINLKTLLALPGPERAWSFKAASPLRSIELNVSVVLQIENAILLQIIGVVCDSYGCFNAGSQKRGKGSHKIRPLI